jgi:dTDP-4-amino-4,6-dideoxygalactose transaminase
MSSPEKAIIPFNKPCLEGNEVGNILESVLRGKIAGDGKFNTICHKEIGEDFGASFLLTTSGTAALEMSAILCGLEPDDEVIMPSYTFVSTANAFCLMGAKPVFVDIRKDTLNINEKLIEEKITERTKAIVPVHYAGISCDMKMINEIASRHGLMVIEDAAHGFLGTDHGKLLGTFGQLGCFSFHETKSFISGEGGAIVVNDPRLIERAEIIREKGTNRSAFFRGDVQKYTWMDVGSSYLPSDMIGAFLYGQWLERKVIIKKRQRVYDRYVDGLQCCEGKYGIQLPVIPTGAIPNYHMFYMICHSEDQRNGLLDHLQNQGVKAVFHYIPLHSSPYAVEHYGEFDLPVTDAVSSRIIRLPFFNSLSTFEQDYIVAEVLKFFSSSLS